MQKSKVKNTTQNLKVLGEGGLIVAPTDTVYGLLCDATNEDAVKKLITFKDRPAGKPISVFVSDFKMLKDYVVLDNEQESIVKELFPGPFTIILKSRGKVSKLLESEDGTLGVRIPRYEFITNLVKKFGKPITATSANLSGRPPTYDINLFLKTLSKKKKELIDTIVDIGKLPRNKPSTVIDLTRSEVKMLREGDLKFTKTQKFISNSESETKRIARNILNSKKRPLIFILKGDLGAGKTVFVKGIGEALGIKDIVSPTFVIYYEYNIKSEKRKAKSEKLIHVDLYNLEKAEEFKHLGLEKYLVPGNIFCIEWGEKSEPILEQLKTKGKVVYIEIKYIDTQRRELIVQE